MKFNVSKVTATIVSGLICTLLMHYTHGDHGIGWFVFLMFCIWATN